MTIQECYQQLGGDYSDMVRRLPNVNLIRKFLTRFPEDDSYSSLCRAMEGGDRADAFRAAHTLKGVCANLSLNRLLASVSRLTELLRPEGAGIPADAARLLDEVKCDYTWTINAIRAYTDSRSD